MSCSLHQELNCFGVGRVWTFFFFFSFFSFFFFLFSFSFSFLFQFPAGFTNLFLWILSFIFFSSLSDGHIFSEDATLLAEALKKNTSVAVLYLRGNMIGDAGAIKIAEALEVNNSLQELDLSGLSPRLPLLKNQDVILTSLFNLAFFYGLPLINWLIREPHYWYRHDSPGRGLGEEHIPPRAAPERQPNWGTRSHETGYFTWNKLDALLEIYRGTVEDIERGLLQGGKETAPEDKPFPGHSK